MISTDACRIPLGRLFRLINPLRPGGLRSARLAASLSLLVIGLALVGPALAETVDIEELRELIAENGWSFEVDDTFINSLTPEARANLHGFKPPEDWEKILESRRKLFAVPKQLPSSWDWRDMNGETPVKNQGDCGSCWAFAAMGEIESRVKSEYGVELDLSEQQAISCNTYGSGCGGGTARAVYQVCQNYGGISEHCMPYGGGSADAVPCTQTDHFPLARTTDWHWVSNNVEQIKTALLDGPVCTAVDGSGAFDSYSSGCLDAPGSGTNHLIVIMGWDDRLCGGEGAWIVKNSWGPTWGMAGYGYIKYGACNVGIGVTQCEYTPPPTSITVTSPGYSDILLGETQAEITWSTSGAAVANVDIWFSVNDTHFESMVAENVPNTGSYMWDVPNSATESGRLLIFPSTGTEDGFGFSVPLTILGHKVRYVSAAGSNSPPYETPATAAHTIADAVLACTGSDSVMIAADDYFETVTISSTVRLFGGWNADFTARDIEAYPTRLRGVSSAVKFLQGSGDFGGVDGIIFHDCYGGYYSDPEFGQHGGAIYSLGASPTVSNCVFLDNRASSTGAFGLGGAMLAVGGNPVIAGCRFEGNDATKGGAVALIGSVSVSLSDNTFLANTCSDSGSGYLGGALYASGGQISSSGDLFQYNGGTDKGGAFCLEGASLTAQNLRLLENRSINNGGAVYSTGGNLELLGGEVSGNRAGGNGAGLYGDNGAVVLRNVHLLDNLATNMGGGVMFMNLTGGCIENCLTKGNQAAITGGGLFAAATGSYQVRNNIIMSNTGGGLVAVGASLVADYNNVWNNSGGDYGGGGQPGEHDLSADPLFVDAAGGDYGLAVHTPCLDRGDPDPGCTDPDGSPADIGSLGGPSATSVAPAAIAGAEIQDIGGGQYRLSWTANAEPDMAQYVVYRDTAEVFSPSPAKTVVTVDHPTTQCDVTPPYVCYYLIVAVDGEGHVGGYSPRLYTEDLSAIADSGVPAALSIAAVVPNPFNPRTTIWFDVPRQERVSLCVYDLRGRSVRELLAAQMPAGRHSVDWDGTDASGREVAAGVYFMRLANDERVITTKVLLAK